MHEMTFNEFRDGLKDALNRVKYQGETIVVTRRGGRDAMLVPVPKQPTGATANETVRKQMLAAVEALSEDPAQEGDATVAAIGVLLAGMIRKHADGLGRDYAGDLAHCIEYALDYATEVQAPGNTDEQTRLSGQVWDKLAERAPQIQDSIARYEAAPNR